MEKWRRRLVGRSIERRLPPSSIVLTDAEIGELENVLYKLYGKLDGETPKIRIGKKQTKGWEIDPEVTLGEKGKGGKIIIELVTSSEAEGFLRSNNPLFNAAFSQLPPEDQVLILNYLNSGNKILAVRRTSPSSQFLSALIEFCERHLGGFSPLIPATLVYYTLSSPEEARDSEDPISQEIRQLQKLSQKMTPVHFFPVSKPPDFTKRQWKRLKNAFSQLNACSNRFEFVYDALMTASKLQGIETTLTGGFLGLGVLLLPLLPRSKNQWAMIGSQLSGEVLTALVNRFDLVVHQLLHLLPPSFKKFLGHMGIALANTNFSELTPLQLTSLEKNVNQINKAISFFSLVLATASAIGLTHLSINTENLLYFFSIAPLNSTLLALAEILKRTLSVHALLKAQEEKVAKTVVEFLGLEKPQLKQILTRYPSLAIGLLDFLTNKPAFYSWLLTYASFLLYFVNRLQPLPMNVNEVLTGLIFEGIGGLYGLISGRRRDPWEAFQRLLPLLAQYDRTNNRGSDSP